MLVHRLILVTTFVSVHGHGIEKPYVTVVRTDGFGAQLQERITCLIQSRVTSGLSYVHTPMKALDHLRSASWRVFQDLEDYINLGQGELRIEDVPEDQLQVVDGCAEFVNANIGLLELFKGELRLKYERNKECYNQRAHHLELGTSHFLQVHVHIRRGDVGEGNAEKWLDVSHHLKIMQKVSEAARLVHMSPEYHVHSEGNTTDFLEFAEKFSAKLHIGEDMISSWKAMTKAEVLVMSRSSFSYTAALYNPVGVVIYTNMRPSEPLPSWLEAPTSIDAIAERLKLIKVFRNLGSLHSEESS